jgi:hypothetical protein
MSTTETVTEKAKHNPFHDLNPCYLGDFVEHINEPRLKGRIHQVHWSCPEKNTWLRGQTLLGPNPMQYKDGRWVSILTHEGGAIVVPDSFVRVIDPFPIRNNNMGMYFPLDEWVERDRPEPEGVPGALAQVASGERISVWAFEVHADGEEAGAANWWSGTVVENIPYPMNDHWRQVTFEDGTMVRAVAYAKTKLLA